MKKALSVGLVVSAMWVLATVSSAVAKDVVFRIPDFGVSFHAPSGWKFRLIEKSSQYVRYDLTSPDRSGLCGVHVAVVNPMSSTKLADALIKSTADALKKTGTVQTVAARRNIATKSGIAGVEVLLNLAPDGHSKRNYYVHKRIAYIVDCEGLSRNWPSLIRTYDKVLSTFDIKR